MASNTDATVLALCFASVIIFVAFVVAIYELALHIAKKIRGKEKMNKILIIARYFDSLVAILLEIGMYVSFFMGRISLYQLIIGFCLLRIAGYCFQKGKHMKHKRRDIPYAD